ncbi:MAG: ETC complex I subunit [Micavibrio sp.]
MTSVRIYKPSKSAMQSGRGKGQKWVLETETTTARQPENLMGWVSSGDTLNQVKISFDTLEDAIKHAETKGWAYSVSLPQERKVRPRNYADNHRYVPAEKRS